MLVKLLLLAAAGAAGTLARYGLHAATHRWLFPAPHGLFPWGTVAVNAAGCLAFGLVFGLTETRTHLPPATRLVLLTGFMGAFTTFSTFAHDTAHLARAGSVGLAAANLAAHNVAGLALAALGFALGTRL